MANAGKAPIRGAEKPASAKILKWEDAECSHSNLHAWREYQFRELGVKYGSHANIIMTGKFDFGPTPAPIAETAEEMTFEPSVRELMKEANKQQFLADHKAWSKAKYTAETVTYKQIFADLVRNIDEANMIKIRSCDTATDEAAKLELVKDTSTLMSYILKTHQGDKESPDAPVYRMEAERRFNALRCDTRDIVWLYNEFNRELATMRALGCTIPKDVDLVETFLYKLPAKYSKMKADWANNRREFGIAFKYPVTVAKAYEMAVAHVGVSVTNGKAEDQKAFSATFESDDVKSSSESSFTEEQKAFLATFNALGAGGGRGTPPDSGSSVEQGGRGGRRDRATIRCYGCGELGHFRSKCPSATSTETKDGGSAGERRAYVCKFKYADDSEVPGVDTVTALKDELEKTAFNASAMVFKEWELGIDTMAGVSIWGTPTGARNIHSGATIRVHGIGGKVTTNQWCEALDFDGLAYVPGSPNLLSLALIADRYDVKWEQSKHRFTVITPGARYLFVRVDNTYVCDLREHLGGDTIGMAGAVETVEGNERLYTTREVTGARRAKMLSEALDHPGVTVLAKMLRHNLIVGNKVSPEDLHRAVRIYGPDLAAVKGKTKRTTPPVVITETGMGISVPDGVDLHTDVMFVEGMPFLIAVATPLSYIFCELLKSRQCTAVKTVLMSFIGKLASYGFRLKTLLCDGEGAVGKLRGDLEKQGICVNITSREHVPHVENRIRTVKERIRGILAVLPFVLCLTFMVYAVKHVVCMMNKVPSEGMSEFISPVTAMTGRPVHIEDITLPFLQYVEAHERGTSAQNSVTNPRTRSCLALYPRDNAQHSWWFYTLDKGTLIARDRYTIMPMNDAIIGVMAKMAETKKTVGADPTFSIYGRAVTNPDVETSPARRVRFDDEHLPGPVDPASNMDYALENMEPVEGDLPEIADLDGLHNVTGVSRISDDSHVPAESADDASSPADQGVDVELPMSSPLVDAADEDRESLEPLQELDVATADDLEASVRDDMVVSELAEGRSGYNLRGNRRYGHKHGRWQERDDGSHDAHAYRISVNQALKRFPKAAMDEMSRELLQLHSRPTWHPVRYSSLSFKQKSKVIRSHMFLKEKYFSNGEFEKLKARLVAGGHMQDRSSYGESDFAAPTVALSSVYMVAAVAAREGRMVATMDVPGAFLNADLKEEVFMQLEPRLARMLSDIAPEYASYAREDGGIVLGLDKALYGLGESAKLWYDTLCSKLMAMGFVANRKDPCVFNKDVGGNQITACVYVDDLMVTCCDERAISQIHSELCQDFGAVTLNQGKVHSYLGQTFDFSVGDKCKVTMEGYVDDMLSDFEVIGHAATPALEDLFSIRESVSLKEWDKERFHSAVAKLLYLAKRARPDLLTAVTFLTTRVVEPTAEDQLKLARVFRYINSTREFGMCLNGSGAFSVVAYVDASYGVHPDFKSHTGSVLRLGEATVYVKSSKQKLNTKSSTEAEIVGVSDSLSQAIWTREFLQEQGYVMGPIILKQDNKSTMVLLNKGMSTSERTRHIGIRFFFVKDRIETKEVVLEYLPTTEMVADVMTKPLQGELFRKMRALLLGWDSYAYEGVWSEEST